MTDFSKFKPYKSRPITRMALELPVDAAIEWMGPNTYRYEDVIFKAHTIPRGGDFVCRLTMEDTYHVERAVFIERNIVEEK